jgi:hypothetical protein
MQGRSDDLRWRHPLKRYFPFFTAIMGFMVGTLITVAFAQDPESDLEPELVLVPFESPEDLCPPCPVCTEGPAPDAEKVRAALEAIEAVEQYEQETQEPVQAKE